MTEIIENAIDAQLVKSIEGIPFVCLFSILCFGQKLIGIHRDGSESCLNYDHPSGSSSLKCSAGFKFETLNDTNFHTVAIYGNHYYDSDKLSKISAKNLVLKDLKLNSSREWKKSGTQFEMRQSLTLMDVKLSSYTNRLHFFHIYIERSDLSTVGSISAASLPPKLRTLSLVSCLIKDLPPGIFSHTKSLEMLTITRNSLTSFRPSFFSKFGLDSLWFLDLSFNKIDYIPEDFVVYFPNLAEINLQSNHLQKLPEQPFLRKWIDIDIVNLDANALICERLLWSTEFKPHPIFFDSAECYLEDFSHISLGSLSLIK